MSTLVEIESKAYGRITIAETAKISFPQGLYGLSDLHDYYLIEENENPFLWLQAADDVDVAFPIISPFIFRPDYGPKLNPHELASIGIDTEDLSNSDHVTVYVIVTIPSDDPNQMTANLMGPLVINAQNQLGLQALASNPAYTTRHPILEEMQAAQTAAEG